MKKLKPATIYLEIDGNTVTMFLKHIVAYWKDGNSSIYVKTDDGNEWETTTTVEDIDEQIDDCFIDSLTDL